MRRELLPPRAHDEGRVGVLLLQEQGLELREEGGVVCSVRVGLGDGVIRCVRDVCVCGCVLD